MVPPFRMRYLQTLAVLAAIGCVWAGTATGVRGDGKRVMPPWDPKAPTEIAGEAVVRIAPGANIQTILQQLGPYHPQVKNKLHFAPDTYVLKGIYGAADPVVTKLRTIPGVLGASPNRIFHYLDLPTVSINDQFGDRQWALRVMNARKGWSIAVG